tara:strand:+ start:747 stop:1730 length:984 start_codon:yes stop_codon:yes gene_type:complete
MKYKAYLIEDNEGKFSGSIKELDVPSLSEGRVLIRVKYSSLNYKDALAASGAKGVVRSYPFVPGVDVAGEIIESSSSNFSIGDSVIATGYKMGMAEFGGFGEIVHLPEEWVIRSPKNFSNFQAMCFGTAGITAAECVKKIVDKKISNSLPIVVSGSTGGVGSVAVGLLSKLGYEVHAITGKPNESDVLKSIGATEIISRDEYMSEPTKALDKGIYASGVDTVGGDILAKMISMISNQGVVSCCGNVGGAMFSSSVFPFILRGVQLSGIDSAESPIEVKRELWSLLSDSWSIDLEKQTKTVDISNIGPEIDKILKGGQVGRVVIKHGD